MSLTLSRLSHLSSLPRLGAKNGVASVGGELGVAVAIRTLRRMRTGQGRFISFTPLTLPSLSPTMTQGRISRWNIQPNTPYKEGDILMSVETDKADMEVEAQEEGKIGKVLVEAGSDPVPVGTTVALLAEIDEDLSNVNWEEHIPSTPSPSSPSPQLSSTSSSPTSPSPSPPSPSSGSTPEKDSHPHYPAPLPPSVQRLLILKDILEPEKTIGPKGSGRGGRLTKEDVIKFLTNGEKPTPKSEEVSEESTLPEPSSSKLSKKASEMILDGPQSRRLIVDGMTQPRHSQDLSKLKSNKGFDYDALLNGYQIPPTLSPPVPNPLGAEATKYQKELPSQKLQKTKMDSFYEGLGR